MNIKIIDAQCPPLNIQIINQYRSSTSNTTYVSNSFMPNCKKNK
jgi:hypothetical protein